MRRRLTQKQETFCLKYFEKGNATQAALLAGYSKRTARTIASSNLTKVDILERLKELRKLTEDESIANALERRRVLTQIVRARQTDYMICSADGVWMHDFGEETLNSVALKKLRTATMPFGDKDSELKIILTEVELLNPMKAIDLLNKMDKLYQPEGGIIINEQPQASELSDEELIIIIRRRSRR